MVTQNRFVDNRRAGRPQRVIGGFAEPVSVPYSVRAPGNSIRSVIIRAGNNPFRGAVLLTVAPNSWQVYGDVSLEPGELYTMRVVTSSSNTTIAVSVDGVPLFSSYQPSNTSYVTFRFRPQAASPVAPTAVAAPGEPRYLVKSPPENGYVIESVRTIGPGEVARLRNQGFTVTATTAAPSPAIRTRVGGGGRRAPSQVGARERRGISTAPPVRVRRVRTTTGPDIRHKSTRERVFMEPMPSDWVALAKQVGARIYIVIVRGRHVYSWIRGGYQIVSRYADDADGRRAIINYGKLVSQVRTNNVRWVVPRPSESRPYVAPSQPLPPAATPSPPTTAPSTPTPPPATSPAPTPSTPTPTQAADISALESRLANIDRNLVKLGTDSTALGQSTSQRAAEIAQLRADYQRDAQDLHKKVADLGRSGVDASGAIAQLTSQIAALDAKVAAAAGASAAAGGADFGLGSLTQLLPLIVIVMVIGMMAKVAK